jgi:hypothetical protein
MWHSLNIQSQRFSFKRNMGKVILGDLSQVLNYTWPSTPTVSVSWIQQTRLEVLGGREFVCTEPLQIFFLSFPKQYRLMTICIILGIISNVGMI